MSWLACIATYSGPVGVDPSGLRRVLIRMKAGTRVMCLPLQTLRIVGHTVPKYRAQTDLVV
jgi:hypothetical protein